jgi:hypothetical protein
MTKTLYIIGNGFDLFHGIPSSYWHFKAYVEKNDNALFTALEKYFDSDELWSDFEGTLAHLDIDQIRDEANNYLVSYGAEDWSDAYHHDYQYEIEQRVSLVSEKLLEHFRDWVCSLKQPELTDLPLLLDHQALFLNFNYTPTLQSVYRIDDTSVLHIHHKAAEENSELILGHGWKPKPVTPVTAPALNEDGEPDYDGVDPRVEEGEVLLNRYFKDTYKPVEQILRQQSPFFESLAELEKIYVLGHSLSDVDLPYFEAIIAQIDTAKTHWYVSYFKETEKQTRIDALTNLGIPESNIHLEKMEQFGKDPGQQELF